MREVRETLKFSEPVFDTDHLTVKEDTMNTKRLGCALLLLAFFAVQATTTEPDARLLSPVQNAAVLQQKEKDQPKPADKDKDKKLPEKKMTDPPDTDLFTRTPTPIRDELGFTPNMLGDWQAKYSHTRANVIATTTTTSTFINLIGVPVTTTTARTTVKAREFLIPVPIQGSFKVAENASPMPVDRVYFTYNFYNDIRSLQSGQNVPIVNRTTTTTTIVGQGVVTTTVTNVIPGAPSFVNLHRETLGFETTFLDGNASIEMRLPFSQQPSSLDEFRSERVGDITVIGKYALFLDRTTGNVFSTGLAVTAPTGPGIQTIDGSLHSTLLQPWFGYIWNYNQFYVHAFHSAVFPTDNRDVSLLFNDVGVGYWLYRAGPDRLLSFVVPTLEVHVTTPLNNRGVNEPIVAPDLVHLTGGLIVGLGRNSTLSIGVGTPVTGQRPYGFESVVQFNRRF